MIKVTVYLKNGEVIEFWQPKLANAINIKDYIEHETFCHVVDGETVFISADEVDHVDTDADHHIDKHARAIVRGIIKDFTDRRGLRQEWEQIDDQVQAEIIIRWREIARDILKEL